MKYLNAEKGIKKIYISQFLYILTAVLVSITSLFSLFFKSVLTISELDELLGLILVSVFFAFALTIALIGSAILGIIGYFQAARDEPEFRKPMICTFAFGITALASSFLQIPNDTLHTIFDSASTIIEMFVIIFALSGIIRLSVSCDRSDMADRGGSLMKIMVITYIISAMDALTIRIFELSQHAKIVSLIIGAIDLALIVTRYVLYLRYLRYSAKMLTDHNAAN